MKCAAAISAFGAILAFVQFAQAGVERQGSTPYQRASSYAFAAWTAPQNQARQTSRHPDHAVYAYAAQADYHSHYEDRPAAWCGWQMRRLVARDPGPEFNLARNWARWGRPGPAGVGAVVVWPHHVGKIVGREDGMWLIESGNDDHALRTRPFSIAGAIAIRWE
jgi:hypothetical protein